MKIGRHSCPRQVGRKLQQLLIMLSYRRLSYAGIMGRSCMEPCTGTRYPVIISRRSFFEPLIGGLYHIPTTTRQRLNTPRSTRKSPDGFSYTLWFHPRAELPIELSKLTLQQAHIFGRWAVGWSAKRALKQNCCLAFAIHLPVTTSVNTG